MADPVTPPAADPLNTMKVNVFTASYGGQKAALIASYVSGALNLTILDVNEGREQKEIEAYKAAYAKNGISAGVFPNQTRALDKAFEIAPNDTLARNPDALKVAAQAVEAALKAKPEDKEALALQASLKKHADEMKVPVGGPGEAKPAQPAAGAAAEKAGGGGQVPAGDLKDKAPSGSFEKAPLGALAGRDYSQTELDPEKARDIINAYRKEQGLKPLTLNADLTAAAKAHSRDLAKHDRTSHFGSDGSNPWDRVKRTGYNARLAAENVGTGQQSFEEVMEGWKKSPGHNKNLLLSDAKDMGIALVKDPKSEFKTFTTLVLGSKM